MNLDDLFPAGITIHGYRLSVSGTAPLDEPITYGDEVVILAVGTVKGAGLEPFDGLPHGKLKVAFGEDVYVVDKTDVDGILERVRETRRQREQQRQREREEANGVQRIPGVDDDLEEAEDA